MGVRGAFVEQKQGESPNDRNDRAIREAVKWFVHWHETRCAHAFAGIESISLETTTLAWR